MPLTMVREGTRAVLRSITSGRQMRGRLAALGLLPGTELEVVQNSGKGPFIVRGAGQPHRDRARHGRAHRGRLSLHPGPFAGPVFFRGGV